MTVKEEKGTHNLVLAGEILNAYISLRDNEEVDVTKDKIIQSLQSVHVRDTLLLLATNYSTEDQRRLSHFIYELVGKNNPDVGHYTDVEKSNITATAAALVWYTVADEPTNETAVALTKDLVGLTLKLNPSHSLGNLFKRCLEFKVPYSVFKESIQALTLAEVIVK